MLRSTPLGYWQVLAHVQLLEATESIIACLDKQLQESIIGCLHRFEKQLRAGAALNSTVHLLYKISPSGLEEMIVLYTVKKSTQRVKQNEETGRHVLHEQIRNGDN